MDVLKSLSWQIFMGIVSGLISGCLSSYLVYKYTSKAEKKKQAKNNIRNYLFSAFQYMDITINTSLLNDLSYFKNDELKKCIFEIMDILHPENTNDRELNEEEIRLSELISNAMNILNEL